MYVTAEYETDANVLNQVVVWDTIIHDSPSVRAPVEMGPGQRARARVHEPLAARQCLPSMQPTQPLRVFELCRPHCRRGFVHRKR